MLPGTDAIRRLITSWWILIFPCLISASRKSGLEQRLAVAAFLRLQLVANGHPLLRRASTYPAERAKPPSPTIVESGVGSVRKSSRRAGVKRFRDVTWPTRRLRPRRVRAISSEVFTSSPIDLAALARSPPIAFALSTSSFAWFCTAVIDALRDNVHRGSCSALRRTSTGRGGHHVQHHRERDLVRRRAPPAAKLRPSSGRRSTDRNPGSRRFPESGLPASTPSARTSCMFRSAATFSGCVGSFCSIACALSEICCITSLTAASSTRPRAAPSLRRRASAAPDRAASPG